MLVLAIFNPVLRLSKTNPYTGYRLLAPIFILYLILFIKTNIEIFALYMFMFIYNLFISTIAGNSTIDSSVYMIHYLYLFVLFYIINELKIKLGSDAFKKDMYIFFIFILYLLYALFALKLIYKINLFYDYDYDYYINTIFSTPNDLGLVLGLYFILILCSKSESIYKKITHLFFIFSINYYNDAKAAILSHLIALAVYLFVYFLNRLTKYRKVFLGTLTFLILFFLLLLRNVTINFKDNVVVLSDFIIEPFLRILKLTPYRLAGSIYDRADAAIFGLTEFYKTWGLGTGAGTSIEILQKTYYNTATAQSLHNFLLEWLVEFGWLAILIYISAISIFIKNLKKFDLNPNHEFVVMLPSMALLAVSQSSGYISNYLFWSILFYIILNTAHRDHDIRNI